MTKRLKRIIVTCALMLLSVLCLAVAACGSKGYKVRFELNGGTPIAEITAKAGEEIELPTPAEREGFSFEGWYDNAGFSGNPVTKVVVEADKTFYAKWEQLYKVSLEIGRGTLNKTAVYVKAGANLSQSLKDYVPTLDGWQFGEWTMNGQAISAGTVMPAENITLTARYKVGYTVHIFLQKATLDAYEAGEDITGYDYPVTSYTPVCDVNGFEVKEYTGETTHELTDDPAQNVFTFYLDRALFHATFFANYPVSQEDALQSLSVDFYYGTEVTLPFDEFAAEGYLLEGWVNSATGDMAYCTDAVESLLRNGSGASDGDTLVLEEDNNIFYASWNKGYIDMMGGEDLIFRTSDQTDRVILSRCGIYYEGTYTDQANGTAIGTFRFRLPQNDLVEGRLLESGSFAYYDEARDGILYSRYQVGLGIISRERITLDPYNGLKYTVVGHDESQGTYEIDEHGYYVVTFTSGAKQGTTMTLLLGIVNSNDGSQRVFEVRNEDEIAMGTIYRLGVRDNGEIGYYNGYLLTLDGFGTATMTTGTTQTSYFYAITGEMLNLYTSSSSLYGTFKFMRTADGVNGYILYNSALNHTYTNAAGETLVLDGTCNATYTSSTTTWSAHYTYSESVFGGNIIKITRTEGNTERTSIFRVYTVAGDAGKETEGETTYAFEQKDAAYKEYYYKSEGGIYYTPLLVIDSVATNGTSGNASLYGYTATRTYVKVAEGTYQFNPETQCYQFTVTTKITPEGEPITNPIDVTRVQSFIYQIGVASNYDVTYWYSVTYEDGDPTNFDVQYTDEAGHTLTLVGGFAVYKDGTSTVTGVYSSLSQYGNVIRVTAEEEYLYFEIDADQEKFIVLDKMLASMTERLANGEYDSTVVLFFDGKGNATLTTTPADGEPTVVEGTYEEGEETTFGTSTLRFVATDSDAKSFNFLVFTASNRVYFTRSSGVKTYRNGSETLVLDGYSYFAHYTNADGVESEGRYVIPSENVVAFSVNNQVTYFDLKEGNAFTIRGSEAGMYSRFENQYMNGLIYELDGYTTLTVWRAGEGSSEREQVATGKYHSDGNDGWVLEYEDEKGVVTAVGRLGIYAVTTTTGIRVFIIEQEEIKHKYVNESDWSVLIPDGHGNAELHTKLGRVECGTYVIISKELLYYVNSAGTDACIYRYDTEAGTIEKLNYRDRAYYTPDLRSLRFSRYGFMIMDGETRYYYTLNAANEITVYLRDPENADANEYGYVPQNIGTFTTRLTFDGTEYIDNDGYSIYFEREETTKEKYPVYVDDDEEGNQIKKPLKQLVFQPTGAAEFRVAGTVAIDGVEGLLNCTVVREKIDSDADTDEYEFYVMVGAYRFDITVTYSGETGNTYIVTGMRYIRSLISNTYLNMYFFLYMLLGSSYANAYTNTFGVINVIQEYNDAGEQTDRYINASFGSGVNLLLTDGTMVTAVDRASYEYENGMYVATAHLADEYDYKFYFTATVNPYLGVYCYNLYACARVQTLMIDRYEVEVERVVAVESGSASVGQIWNISLKEGESAVEADSIYLTQDKAYYIVRTRTHLETDAADENTGKITDTVYYELVFTEKQPEQIEGAEESNASVPTYEFVTVTKREVKTVYCADGTSYVDLYEGTEQAEVVGFMFESTQYFVKECQYDAEIQTYSVTTLGEAKYTIKIESNDGTEKATITLIPEEEEE